MKWRPSGRRIFPVAENWKTNEHQAFEIDGVEIFWKRNLLVLPFGRFFPMFAKSGTRGPTGVLKLAKEGYWTLLGGEEKSLGRSSSSRSTAVGLAFEAGEIRGAS